MRNFKKAVSLFVAVTMLFTMTACAEQIRTVQTVNYQRRK